MDGKTLKFLIELTGASVKLFDEYDPTRITARIYRSPGINPGVITLGGDNNNSDPDAGLKVVEGQQYMGDSDIIALLTYLAQEK